MHFSEIFDRIEVEGAFHLRTHPICKSFCRGVENGKMVFILPESFLVAMNCKIEDFQKENPGIIVKKADNISNQ